MSEGIPADGKEEQPPKLKIVPIEGGIRMRMKEALEKISENNPAGNIEMEYIRTHPDSEDANKMKNGAPYFFFGAKSTKSNRSDLVPCLRWGGGEFTEHGWWFHESWESYCRAVLKE